MVGAGWMTYNMGAEGTGDMGPQGTAAAPEAGGEQTQPGAVTHTGTAHQSARRPPGSVEITRGSADSLSYQSHTIFTPGGYMTTFMGGQMDVAMAALCVCGWGGRFASLKAANAAADFHLEHGSEGCDHAVAYEDAKTGAR